MSTQQRPQDRQDRPGAKITRSGGVGGPQTDREKRTESHAGTEAKELRITEPKLRWCPGEWCRGPQPVSEFYRGLCRICRYTRPCARPACTKAGEIQPPEAFREGRRICIACRHIERRPKDRERRRLKLDAHPELREKERRESLARYHRQAQSPEWLKRNAARRRRRYRLEPEFRAKNLAQQAKRRARLRKPTIPCHGLKQDGTPCGKATIAGLGCRWHRRPTKAEAA